jgi:hypothetical protein
MQRVSFAVPLAPGQLDDASAVRVLASGSELPAARRGLASRADGSLRSVQLQVDVDVDSVTELTVEIDAQPTGGDLTGVPVSDTLIDPNGEQGPRVWAQLPAVWLSGSGFAGPLLPESEVSGDAAAWASVCDYAEFDTSAFVAAGADTDNALWLYDRGTALFRGYARRGDLVPFRSAYVESAMYRNRLTGSGTATRNGVPGGVADDVKYTYAQNLALHYLLTGDDRFRESAEEVALGMSALWTSPGYAGGADFWTERHAGFSLLAYVWAAMISDDQASTFVSLADDAVLAYLDVQATYPIGYTDAEARCFAHDSDAHGEGYGYFGCSPWMSAILADALWGYIEMGGTHAAAVESSLVQLGRIVARDGRDANDNPFYWMGVGTSEDEVDPYHEHIGESAYIVAMAWHLSGKSNVDLKSAADALVAKFAADGSAPHVRSFNWQCRSAVATPWYLMP